MDSRLPIIKYRKGSKKMKVHTKITFLFIAFLFMLVWQKPLVTQAATTYYSSNQACSLDGGTDFIFVINDSDAMREIDIGSNVNSKETYLSEAMRYTNTLDESTRVGIIGFNDKVTKQINLTQNRYTTDQAFTDLGKSTETGGNDLSLGIEAALKQFAKDSGNNEKHLIIMTTGFSINNPKSLELARAAYEQDVTIHIFGFGSSVNIDDTMLAKIASATGGSYYHSTREVDVRKYLNELRSTVTGFVGDTISSDWTLTDHVTYPNGLLILDHVRVNLNGYNLTVGGDLILQPCAQLRAANRGVITAETIEQRKGATITLNNSQLNVKQVYTQNGLLRVNGDFGGVNVAEVNVQKYVQQLRGSLELAGQQLQVGGDFEQEGLVQLDGGKATVEGNVTQKGFFHVNKGQLYVKGNLTINGDDLRDAAFTENRSLNVGGGLVQVGSQASMDITRSKGNVYQTSGQLFVNNGTVRIFGDYTISDGWLTMIKGSMDTTTPNYSEDDGDYVHVYRDFTTSSPRNHASRKYTQLTIPKNDEAHLTDGVLRVDGNFKQLGNVEFHKTMSDFSQNYTESYSSLNFAASGRHKVLLTGKGLVSAEGAGFTFQHLELTGKKTDYNMVGSQVKWKNLIERTVSSNNKLYSLAINNKAVAGFSPNTAYYPKHVVPAGNFTELVVEAVPQDKNAKVQVFNQAVVGKQAQVLIVVTAPNGEKMEYTVNVTVGTGTDGRVESITLDRKELTFVQENSMFNPARFTIGYTISPNDAYNQEVIWESMDESVAEVFGGIVTPKNPGVTTIIARTVDGNHMATVNVEVLAQYDLLEGIKTLADLVSSEERYNKIASSYNLDDIGIIVPGQYIREVTFERSSTGYLMSGKIEVDSAVTRLEVSINGVVTNVSKPSGGTIWTFSRAGLSISDYIEVIAYNSAGDELERIGTHYPVGFKPNPTISYGFYSLQYLLDNLNFLDLILANHSAEQLRFTFR